VMDEYFMKILKKLDCHYIRTPPNIIYDSYNHFGDAYRVHYVQEWYDYANKCIDLITSGSKNCYRKMDILNIELTNKMDLIRGKNILSRTNACGRFDVMFKLSNNNPAKLSGLIKVLTEALDSTQDDILKAEIYGRIGRAYRDKKVGSDLVAAAEWMRKAADGGIGWANKELFEILWKIDTPESLMEMTSRAYAKAEAGDPDMMGLIGRAFWKGKGIEKDLQSAETWLKKSADAKCQWAKEEYFDLLWDIGTPESLKNMIEYASSESSKGNLMMRARLAKAYC